MGSETRHRGDPLWFNPVDSGKVVEVTIVADDGIPLSTKGLCVDDSKRVRVIKLWISAIDTQRSQVACLMREA